MSGFALAFDEDVLRLGTNPALSPDAISWREARDADQMSASVSGENVLRESDSLFELVQETSREGHAIDAETISQALALLDALPSWVPAPTPAIESDGQVGFDWHFSRDRMLSVNVGPGGMIGYAALNGLESSYGRLPFAGVLPERIDALLRLVLQTTSPR
jgi:hypothetical protein